MKFNRVKVRKPLSYKQQMTPKHIAKYLEKLEKLKEKIKNSWGDEALPNPSFTYRKFLWLPKSFEVFSDRIGNVREVRWLCFANIRCRVYYQTIKVVKFPKLKRFLNRYFFTKFETFGLLEYDETKIQTKDIGFEDYYTYKTVLKNYKEEEYEQGNNRI